MAYKSDNPLFRDLTDEEEESFRQYARTTDPEDMDSWSVYHPVCREEWVKRGKGPKPKMEENEVLKAAVPAGLFVLKEKEPDYLGDSVYAEIDDCGCLVLTTNNGHDDDPRNRIVLEPAVINALRQFVIKNAKVLGMGA